ncbi:antibiotic biosynthesis monooxygenase family protein [Christiangramia sp.]|uniref:putative quinol monooxygenase n=1 Tax=Christiangramia sp. TaxID=1931228 RepID=UPI0026191E5A|nr:antibiotic biosynthesis monooxygenase family protein [Christiangramia sp.]
MKLNKLLWCFLFLAITSYALGQQRNGENANSDPDTMMFRLSEIEVYPSRLDEYITILKEESAASVRLEPGVISIFPMFQKENPTEIRILEIYASKEAYESHLQTSHFKHYKETTLKMVKSLKLIDMQAIDKESMSMIFQKIEE